MENDEKDNNVPGGIAVFEMPLVKGKGIPGLYNDDPENMSNYYSNLLGVEALVHEEMINNKVVYYPAIHVRMLERVKLSSRQGRMKSRRKAMAKVLDIYQKKETWLKSKIMEEEACQGPLVDAIREIEAEGFGVSMNGGSVGVYEFAEYEFDESVSHRFRDLQDYKNSKREELASKLSSAVALFEDENPLEEAAGYLSELRQARMMVNENIRILKKGLRDIDKAKVYPIKLYRSDQNGRNV